MSTAAGIDIGSEAIKAVVLKKTKGRPLEVVAAGAMPLGELGHMEDGVDKNLALEGKLKELVKKVRIRADSRCIGILGKPTTLRYLQVPPVPAWRLEMLVKYELEEKMGEKESSAYDYRTLDLPETGGQDTVLIGAVKDVAVTELMDRGRRAGLGEIEIDLETLGLYNAYFYGNGYDTDKTVLVVDIGAEDVIILLCRNGMLCLIRTLMGGGRRITQVLADKLKVELSDAEEIKKMKGEIIFDLQPSGRPGRAARGESSPVARGSAGGSGASTIALAPVDAGAQPDAPAEEKPPAPQAAGPAEGAAAAKDGAKKGENETATAANKDSQSAPDGGQKGRDSSVAREPLPEAELVTEAESPAAATALINLELDAAEKQKRQMSALGMSSALVPEAASLCAALENAVHYSRQQLKQRDLKLDRVYISGGGGKLKGLAEFMSRRMRLEVLPLEPFKQISLKNLPAEQAAALKAEQHFFPVAVGLALGQLEKGAFSFRFLPEALKERKIFWARGAYLYYAAALVALSLGLFLYTPYRNANALDANNELAKDAVQVALKEKADVEKLIKDNQEKRMRLKQIYNNVRSGQYFLNLLAELKNKKRITDDVYLSSISTFMPSVVTAVGGKDDMPEKPATRGSGAKKETATTTDEESFLAQRRVYLRGFVRGDDPANLVDKVESFKKQLVPCPENPDDERNLFKDLRTLWESPEVVQLGQFYLFEFVLAAYTEGAKTAGDTPAGGPPKNAPQAAAGEPTPPPIRVASPAPAPPAVQTTPAMPQISNPPPSVPVTSAAKAAPVAPNTNAVTPPAPVKPSALATGAPAVPATPPVPATPSAPATPNAPATPLMPAAPASPAGPAAPQKPPKWVVPSNGLETQGKDE